MKVLVSDTSVLIDLDRGSLVEPAFRLPFAFAVPDLLYERELKTHGGMDYIRLGLCVVNAHSPGVLLDPGWHGVQYLLRREGRVRRALYLKESTWRLC